MKQIILLILVLIVSTEWTYASNPANPLVSYCERQAVASRFYKPLPIAERKCRLLFMKWTYEWEN